jgi:hypothetical protein
MEQTQQQLSFKPLEYWKPPKKVVRHIRARSSALVSSRGKEEKTSRSFVKLEEEKFSEDLEKNLEKSAMSFATLGEMIGRRKNGVNSHINMMDSRGAPPAYKVDRDDTLGHPWWNVAHWGKKAWLITVGALAVMLIIIIVAVVETKKANRYPDYSKLTYSLAENCRYFLMLLIEEMLTCADTGSTFFDNFDYFTGYDPSSGFVHYVPADEAAQYNLTYASSSSAILRVDTSVTNETVPNASTGRFSVRITSKTQYGLDNLFIFDVKHTPTGCATWPALWMSDPSNWPTNGEIDIMEAVNVVGSTNNQMTLHTDAGCTMNVKRKETGKVLTTNCVNSTDENAGCGVSPVDNTTFGDTFNNNGGGILAMELRSAGIRIWQFNRSSIPADLSAGSPDPSVWGEATADFPGTDCNIGNHFKNQSIIANIDLCGSWAGATSTYSEHCMLLTFPSLFLTESILTRSKALVLAKTTSQTITQLL